MVKALRRDARFDPSPRPAACSNGSPGSSPHGVSSRGWTTIRNSPRGHGAAGAKLQRLSPLSRLAEPSMRLPLTSVIAMRSRESTSIGPENPSCSRSFEADRGLFRLHEARSGAAQPPATTIQRWMTRASDLKPDTLALPKDRAGLFAGEEATFNPGGIEKQGKGASVGRPELLVEKGARDDGIVRPQQGCGQGFSDFWRRLECHRYAQHPLSYGRARWCDGNDVWRGLRAAAGEYRRQCGCARKPHGPPH